MSSGTGLKYRDIPRSQLYYGQTKDMTTEITDKGGAHPRTAPPSSSTINNNINRTTTREEEEGGGQSNLFGLPREWEQINFFGLNEKIRFGIQQLKNIYNKNHLTASQCESALEAFANDLDKNIIKSTKSPLSFLMGIMLKGEYNAIDPTFKTEEETVFEQQMKAKIAKANRMRELKLHAQEASCDLWIDELAKEDKDQIFAKLKVYRVDKMSDREKEVHLKQYHSDEIWPNELAKMKKM